MMSKIIDWITTADIFLESKMMDRLFGPVRFIDFCQYHKFDPPKELGQRKVFFLDWDECNKDHFHTFICDWGGPLSLECGHPFANPLGSNEWVRCRHCRDSKPTTF